MKIRYKPALLCTAMLSALLLSLAAAGRGERAELRPAEETPHQAAALAETEGYLLREENGQVAVYHGNKLLRRTDIPAALLRKIDRRALQAGIRTDSLEELLRLIEDFDS